MKPPVTTQEARALMEELRRELLRQKRAVGDPRAPMRARPGQEEAFEKVEENLAKAAFILDYLEKGERRERAEAVLKLKRRAVRTAAVLLNAPSPVVQATAIIGVGVALARAIARK